MAMTKLVNGVSVPMSAQEEADVIAAREARAAIVIVPQSVSPRQIRQALNAAGLRSTVEGFVATGDQDTKDWWEFATAFERTHPRLTAAISALGMTDAQADALFIAAGKL